MTVATPDPTAQIAFSIFENKGVYAVLLGSGVSRSAGIPTGWEITLELVKRWGVAMGAGEQDDWVGWYVGQTGEQPNYSTLLERLATTQTERRAIIQGFLEPSDEELEDGLKLPTRAHRAIAAMVKAGHVRVIVTTNFDRLMENALRDVGVEPTVVSSEDTLAGAEPLTHASCYILKIHGDYKDARILNTDVELGEYATKPLPGQPRRITSFAPVIICEQCNSADGTAKRHLGLPPSFTFAPVEIRQFVRPTPHGKHIIRYDLAQMIFDQATTLTPLPAPLFFS